jgi:hypothetical protein
VTRLDPVERWRVLFPQEREILVEGLAQLIEFRRGNDYWLPEQRFLGRMLKQIREVQQRPRPERPWWDTQTRSLDTQDMAQHTEHPDSHTHGLADGCPRCEAAIETPQLCDDENLARIWKGDHKTRTDVKVYDSLYRAAVTHQRLAQAVLPFGDVGTVFDHGGKV